jgi:hypothetical protein
MAISAELMEKLEGSHPQSHLELPNPPAEFLHEAASFLARIERLINRAEKSDKDCSGWQIEELENLAVYAAKQISCSRGYRLDFRFRNIIFLFSHF